MVCTISACVQSRVMAEEMVMCQIGTDPALSALPIGYHVVNGVEMALAETCK